MEDLTPDFYISQGVTYPDILFWPQNVAADGLTKTKIPWQIGSTAIVRMNKHNGVNFINNAVAICQSDGAASPGPYIQLGYDWQAGDLASIYGLVDAEWLVTWGGSSETQRFPVETDPKRYFLISVRQKLS